MPRRSALLVLAVLSLACGDDPKPHEIGPWALGPPCDAFAAASCIDADRIVADVRTLAGPELTGRRAGTPGNDAAVALVDARFELLGLAAPEGMSGRRMPFALDVWVPDAPPTLTIAGTRVVLGHGLEVVEFSPAATVEEAELVFAGYGVRVAAGYPRNFFPDCPVDPATGYDDFAGSDLAGRIAVLLRGLPPGFRASDGETEWLTCPLEGGGLAGAAALGAVGVLYTSAVPASLRTTDFLRFARTAAIPALQITRDRLEDFVPEISDWQAAIDATGAPSPHATGVRASLTVASHVETRSPANVLAVVPGSDPLLRDEVVVIGAHLDHMGQLPFHDTYYPGADDNASGTATMLELAHAVSRSATQPKRTLLFAAWNAEELGLIGSSEYVDAPAYPLADTVAAFSLDMVGDGSPGMLVYGGLEFPQIAATVRNGAAAMKLPDWPIAPLRAANGSDDAPFAWAGVPAALFLTPLFADHDHYHTAEDTPDGVHRETLDAAAKIAWAAIREYALGTEEPATAAATALGRAEARSAPACFGPRPVRADPDPE